MDTLTHPSLSPPPRAQSRWSRVNMGLLCLLVIGGIAGAVWFWPMRKEPVSERNRFAGQPVPVLAAAAERRDMPIMLDGLGTVQAFNSVTIKPMVDGPLLAVNFTEGQPVKKGQLLAQIDPRPFQAALDLVTAKKAQDEALLANARVDLVRYQKLVSNNFTTAQQADTQKALVAQYEALVRQDQAQIDTARTNLSYTSIASPLDGRAGIRQVDPGNIVHGSDPNGLVVVAQLQPVFVVFTLPQQALASVVKAMSQGNQSVVVATQQGGGRSAVLDTGVLSVLDNQIDPATGTIKLKATFPNQDLRLWPGGFVGIRLRTDTAKDAITVPPSAVQRGPRGTFVYTVSEDNIVTRQIIRTGYEDEQFAIILDGLKEGERVVTDGASRLSDGSKVIVTEPANDAPSPGRERPAAPGAQRRRGG